MEFAYGLGSQRINCDLLMLGLIELRQPTFLAGCITTSCKKMKHTCLEKETRFLHRRHFAVGQKEKESN